MRHYLWIIVSIVVLTACSAENSAVKTEITKWQDDKQSAVSLTYDDGTINQFRVALPMMNELGFPGTFYVITGAIPGSEYQPQFIGRPVEEIIEETADTPTDSSNFFERASAIRYSGYRGTHEYHNRAGRQTERGDLEEAYQTIDEGFEQIRSGEIETTDDYSEAIYDVLAVETDVDLITWEEIQTYAEQGHEFGSHTITHPYLAVLDSANMLYELEQSREEILNKLGREHTFSAEGPFGTENERVMEFAYDIYPALRNRMPEPFLEELNRASDRDPHSSDREYVQWQRGPLSDTPMETMKSWIDTSLESDNIWLVLVFHGIEGIGWEPLSEEEIDEYFTYIKQHEEDLWIATFKDVTKYIRQRENATVETDYEGGTVTVELTHSADPEWYDLPLTLKTYLPEEWEAAQVVQGGQTLEVPVQEDRNGHFILYQALPNSDAINISAL